MSYCIIKNIERSEDHLPLIEVIILKPRSSYTEIWEFDTLEEAEEMKETFQVNSDSGHTYKVRKIGEK